MGEITPDTLREKLRDCWYFTTVGCMCLWCGHKYPGHASDCPATYALAAADAWEADRRELADKDAMWRTADRELAEAQAHIEALEQNHVELERDWNDLTKVTERACELTDQECDTIPEEAWPHFDVGTSHLRQGLDTLREANNE